MGDWDTQLLVSIIVDSHRRLRRQEAECKLLSHVVCADITSLSASVSPHQSEHQHHFIIIFSVSSKNINITADSTDGLQSQKSSQSAI